MSCHASFLGALLLLVTFAMAKQNVPQWTEKFRVFATHISDYDCETAGSAIRDGMIYAASSASDITAYTVDGTVKWNLTLDTTDCTVFLGPDGTVYTTANHTSIIAVSPEGKPKWKAADPEWTFDTLKGVVWNEKGDSMFVQGNTGYITALTDGKRVWSKYIGPTRLPSRIGATRTEGKLVFHQGLVYVTTSRAVLTLTPDGDVKWIYNLTGSESKHFASNIVTPGPDGTVYATVEVLHDSARVLHLYQLSADGNFNWDVNLGELGPSTRGNWSTGTPSASPDGSVVFVPMNKFVSDFNFFLSTVAVTAEGAVKWRHPGVYTDETKHSVVTSPDGFVYVTDAHSKLFALNPEDGQELWSLQDPTYLVDAVELPSFSEDVNTMIYSTFLPGTVAVFQSPAHHMATQ